MKKVIAGFVFLLLIASAFVYMQFKPWLESRLEAVIEEKGQQNVDMAIDSLGLSSATLKNIIIGDTSPLILKDISLSYSLRDLLRGTLDKLVVSGVTFELKEDSGKWTITGLKLSSSETENKNLFLFLPITADKLARIPFNQLTMEDSVVTISSPIGALSLPFEFTWQKFPQPKLSYTAEDIKYKHDNFEVSAEAATLDVALEENDSWKGEWQLGKIEIVKSPMPVPVLSGKGKLMVNNNQLKSDGSLLSADKLWAADFKLDYKPEQPEASALVIAHAAMPWKQGTLSIEDVRLTFTGTEPIDVSLKVERVSIAELMQSLTGNRVSATGVVSGILPMRIARDGTITILQGNLKAEEAGTITMPPEAIPGDNEQVALVRDVLQELHYTGLSIAANTNETGELSVLMALEGNNPKVYDGRAVKLNVNLTGDVLEFIQQNILFLANPKALLRPE